MEHDGLFDGSWSYRSFRNDPDLSREFNALRFGAGTLDLATPEFGRLTGSLGGELWVHDRLGYLIPLWPGGVGQRPAIVGSVIRTVPHSGGQAKAGFVASFIAVRQS